MEITGAAERQLDGQRSDEHARGKGQDRREQLTRNRQVKAERRANHHCRRGEQTHGCHGEQHPGAGHRHDPTDRRVSISNPVVKDGRAAARNSAA
jgi:hypothetical protein